MNGVRVTITGLGRPQTFEVSTLAGISILYQLTSAAESPRGRVARVDAYQHTPTATPAPCPDCKGAGVLYVDLVGRGDLVAEPCGRCAQAAG